MYIYEDNLKYRGCLLHGPCQLHVLLGNVTDQGQPTKKLRCLHLNIKMFLYYMYMYVMQLLHILICINNKFTYLSLDISLISKKLIILNKIFI